nr:serine/threonine-protein kinase [Pseudomonas insulae]
MAFANTGHDAAKPRANESIRALPELLCGRYRIDRLLGLGGMGAVYQARDLLREQFGEPEPYVALKVLNEELLAYPDANRLLHREFALLSRLRHQHVVRPLGFEIDPSSERGFLTLELLKGHTLDQLLDEHPEGLPWPALQEVALPLLDALQHAHAQGVLHGDIKPSNVMCSEHGICLFDFGLGSASSKLRRVCGKPLAAWTPRYAAPELFEGASLGCTADIYAVSCLLYQLSRGWLPYRQLNAKQARAMQLQPDVPPGLPRAVWRALRSGLAFEQEKRCSLGELLGTFAAKPRGRWYPRW